MFSLWREISTSSPLNSKMLLLRLRGIITHGKHQSPKGDHPGGGLPKLPSLGALCSSFGETCIQHQCLSSPPNETLVWMSARETQLHLLQEKKDVVGSILGVLLNPTSEIKPGSRTRAGPTWFQPGSLYSVSLLQFPVFVLLSCCCPDFLCSPVLMVGPGHHYQLPSLRATHSHPERA